MDWHSIQGGGGGEGELGILLVASCHGNQDKLRPYGPSGSYAETLPYLYLFAQFTEYAGKTELNKCY